jgi:hypothetical protein
MKSQPSSSFSCCILRCLFRPFQTLDLHLINILQLIQLNLLLSIPTFPHCAGVLAVTALGPSRRPSILGYMLNDR